MEEVNQIVPTQLNCAIDLILADVSIQGLTDGVAKPIQAAIKPKVIKPLDQVRSATQSKYFGAFVTPYFAAYKPLAYLCS